MRRFDLDSPPEIENLKQCQMDAKMGVHSSIYIHMRVSSLMDMELCIRNFQLKYLGIKYTGILIRFKVVLFGPTEQLKNI